MCWLQQSAQLWYYPTFLLYPLAVIGCIECFAGYRAWRFLVGVNGAVLGFMAGAMLCALLGAPMLVAAGAVGGAVTGAIVFARVLPLGSFVFAFGSTASLIILLAHPVGVPRHWLLAAAAAAGFAGAVAALAICRRFMITIAAVAGAQQIASAWRAYDLPYDSIPVPDVTVPQEWFTFMALAAVGLLIQFTTSPPASSRLKAAEPSVSCAPSCAERREMKVLIIGNGGREHALAWRLAESPTVTGLLAMPGNPGMAQVADLVPGDVTNFSTVEKVARQHGTGLVVIGPEDPLAAGLADHLAKAGIRAFGPSADAARIEADKWFAKEIMRQQAVPTAEARSFTDPSAAEEFVKLRDEPVVIKAAGLAKGKGVAVCYRTADALDAIDRIMRKKEFGSAGARVVVEELLIGPECSILAFISNRSIYIMETAQDHKPVDDGDTGPMTGGMGAYTPTPVVTEKMISLIERDVLVPIVDGLIREGIKYQGVLYAGLMMTANGPKVLEFNCRFGDPETQPLMMRLKSDLLEVMLAVVEGKLENVSLRWDPRPALAVVATSRGYPGKYSSGVPISGVDRADGMRDVKVFHSGTAMQGRQLVTAGGRVLSVTALGSDIKDAQRRAYEAMKMIQFDGMHYRRDIGRQATA